MQVLLISTYELGRQPFGLASPAAWLRRAGALVECVDLSRHTLNAEQVRAADMIALYVPMHTAARLAAAAMPKIRMANPRAHICFYGLYAPVNEAYFRSLGAQTILGGEFEAGLVSTFKRVRSNGNGSGPSAAQAEPVISLGKQEFIAPDRAGLPPLARYAHLNWPDGAHRTVGHTEASRGCKHLCRHCPVVPVYNGQFRIVQPEIVLEDVRGQVAAGAQHITFGDPDFFNGPRHAMEIVTAMHREHPQVSYDVTIKIEHLLHHAALLPTLRDTGCIFVTSAAESVDDSILARLDKGHSYADFVRVVELFRQSGLALSPTFVAFTPWTTIEGYCDLLARLAELDLVENVAPIQLAIRLLIPSGSRLFELDEVRALCGPYDPAAMVYPWANADPRLDDLGADIQKLVRQGEKEGQSRRAIFLKVWNLTQSMVGNTARGIPAFPIRASRATIPYLNEPWYC
ncbi:MAG TPA: CUAEP/CCAEP-tail radical SAM protein [Terriglobia bacterium]|nr:CUAEP/CCAEP-tail radical SAM protein [Terriglobia bacterium]